MEALNCSFKLKRAGVALAAMILAVSFLRGQDSIREPIPIQMSGKVVLEDGTPPPKGVQVEAFSGPQIIPLGRTDSKGGFVVQWPTDSKTTDARFSGPFEAYPTQTPEPFRIPKGCYVRARLAGYESSRVIVVNDGVADLGTIVLRRITTKGSSGKSAQPDPKAKSKP
jgi:hypothetical protein